jgi:hypothetical protein
MMDQESVYLVLDYDGYKVVANSGGAQMVVAGPCMTMDEALRQAFVNRGRPVAIRLTPVN